MLMLEMYVIVVINRQGRYIFCSFVSSSFRGTVLHRFPCRTVWGNLFSLLFVFSFDHLGSPADWAIDSIILDGIIDHEDQVLVDRGQRSEVLEFALDHREISGFFTFHAVIHEGCQFCCCTITT
jgi:hypothetical protein